MSFARPECTPKFAACAGTAKSTNAMTANAAAADLRIVLGWRGVAFNSVHRNRYFHLPPAHSFGGGITLAEQGKKMEAKTIEELPGVGPATADKLKEAGYTDMMSLAVASPGDLADLAEIGETAAEKIIVAARRAADVGGFETGDVILERRKSVAKLTTGSKAFDELLGGGLETQAITECYGEFGSGKSQLAHQLAVNVTRSEDEGGLGGDTVWIDTEQTFRPERIRHMSEALDLDSEAILKQVHVARAFNSHHQMLLVEKAKDLAKDFRIRLVVIDSLTAHFRAEYIGRGVLAERQQLLNKHIHELMRFGDLHN